MIRKVLAFPFKVLCLIFGVFFMMFNYINAMVMGKSINQLNEKVELLFSGLKAANKNEDNAIVELVEKHYGSGKAMQVSEILEQEGE